jgi:RHS repeat-associated protein
VTLPAGPYYQSVTKLYEGARRYEITNHLGNVLATLSDRKRGMNTSASATTATHYEAVVQSATDYYAFGQEMPGRTFTADGYRFGFNGKENDKDWGTQLIQDFGFRLYNPGLGRFLSVDPLEFDFPSWTPYHFVHNNPVRLTDPTGMKADSTYEINTKTGEFKVINGKGGDEIDYIQLWNGEGKCLTTCKLEEPFPVVVEDAFVHNSEEGYVPKKERYPGYRVHFIGSNGAIEPVDDPFTGGVQKAPKVATKFAVGLGFNLLSTSSRKMNPSVVYAIMKNGKFYKFGVSGADLKRYHESLKLAGEGATGRIITKNIPKWNAHIVEKYFVSLHWRKYGRMPTKLIIPFPINLLTGKRINPNE